MELKITEEIKQSAKRALEQLRKEQGDIAADTFLESHGGMEGLYQYCAKVNQFLDKLYQNEIVEVFEEV